MNLANALIEVSRGHKITCPYWKTDGTYITQDLLGNLVYFDGSRKIFEPVQGNYIAQWIKQKDKDWELLEEGSGSGKGCAISGHTEPFLAV